MFWCFGCCNLPSTSRRIIAGHTTAIAFMFTTKLSAASTTAKIIRAHLCHSIVTARRVHLRFTLCSLSILICIPGCFKLNYFSFLLPSKLSLQNTKCLWRLTMISEKMLTEVVEQWKWENFFTTLTSRQQLFLTSTAAKQFRFHDLSVEFLISPRKTKVIENWKLQLNHTISQIKINWSAPEHKNKEATAPCEKQ
jgi:hypothetical protein